MSQETEQKVKIRFKFRSGEEFEAEGNPDFIERQRAQFLYLIGKQPQDAARKENSLKSSESYYKQPASFATPALPAEALTATTSATDTQAPAFLRRTRLQDTDSAALPANPAPISTRAVQETRLWEELVKTEENLVILRRKNRLLTAETAALVLIAAAKVLLGAQSGYSALHLSKSLSKSGYGGERLDRTLGGEIRRGTVKSEGSKRSRVYLLSDEGFAKAFVLAEKLAGEWR